MKKIISFILAAGFLFAGDISGIIQDISISNKTITVNNNVIYLNPYVKIEKDRSLLPDKKLMFKDLKVGDFVEVDCYTDKDNNLVAEEIEVKENRKPIY